MNIDGFIKPVTHKLSVKAICYFAYPPKETKCTSPGCVH